MTESSRLSAEQEHQVRTLATAVARRTVAEALDLGGACRTIVGASSHPVARAAGVERLTIEGDGKPIAGPEQSVVAQLTLDVGYGFSDGRVFLTVKRESLGDEGLTLRQTLSLSVEQARALGVALADCASSASIWSEWYLKAEGRGSEAEAADGGDA